MWCGEILELEMRNTPWVGDSLTRFDILLFFANVTIYAALPDKGRFISILCVDSFLITR